MHAHQRDYARQVHKSQYVLAIQYNIVAVNARTLL